MSPTLFPYTTLFRSATRAEASVSRASVVPIRADDQSRGQEHRGRRLRRAPGSRRVLVRHPDYAGDDPGDRKSTRLNSSHLVISYAVFCLKKKILVR